MWPWNIRYYFFSICIDISITGFRTFDIREHEHTHATIPATSGPTTPDTRRRRHDRPAHHTPCPHSRAYYTPTMFILSRTAPGVSSVLASPPCPPSFPLRPALAIIARDSRAGASGRRGTWASCRLGGASRSQPAGLPRSLGIHTEGSHHSRWTVVHRSTCPPPGALRGGAAARSPGGGKTRKDSVFRRLWLGGWMAAVFAGF